MEDNEVGNIKLLIVKSNKKCVEIYGRLQFMLEDKKLYRTFGRKIYNK